MTNLIIQKNSSETLNPAQKTFHRLNQQINDLKHTLDLRRNELETGSVFYCQHIIPSEKAVAQALTELTKVRYLLYKNRSDLKAFDRKALKEVMLFETETILELSNPLDVDPEIEAILKKLQGKGHTESLKELGEEMKEALEAMFKAQGMNVDLSEIDPLEPQEEVMRKIFEAFQQGASSRKQAAPAKPKPQSEKQIKKQKKLMLSKKPKRRESAFFINNLPE